MIAKKALEILEGQSRQRDIEIAQSRVDQARGRLAMVDAQLGYAQIKSPFAGTLTEQFVFPGDMAKPDTPLFTIADLSVAIARAQVPESEAGPVRSGETCAFAAADKPEPLLTGRISVVNQAVDPARRTVEVWCEIPNTSRALRAAAFGTLEIATGAARRAVAVPVAAVLFEEGTTKGAVMVVGADKKAKKREVETAKTTAGKVEVTKGLAAGEIVIVEGGYGLPDGTEVKKQE